MHEQFAIMVKELSVGKHSEIRMENTVMQILFIGTLSSKKKFFLTNEITIFRNLKTESFHVWLKAKDIALSVLTVYLIFQVVKNFPKLIIYLGLVIFGTSWQQLLPNLDPVTGTCMYNQLLKLINERREQKKMIKEKEFLKESVGTKEPVGAFGKTKTLLYQVLEIKPLKSTIQ